jgi:hypothetical protein
VAERRTTTIVERKNKARERKSQVDLFREKARELGADDTEGEDEVMRRLAGQERHEAAKKQGPGRKGQAP